jgi:glycosyltransferase involved in cell wall biosynthesis
MVSVVIPTYNRRSLLKEALESLLGQEYPRERYEVVVVDNSSTDGTDEMVHEVQDRAPGLIRYLRKENEGPVVARNFGIEHARGELIAFTDSDCVASPRWLAEGARAAAEGYTMIQGPTLPKPHQPNRFLSRTVNAPQTNWAYPTCNIFYARELLQQAGGFDPRMNFGTKSSRAIGCDDAEMGWRARRHGARFTFAPGALVYHEVFQVSWQEFLINEPLRGFVAPYALQFIPELRRVMFLRFFAHMRSAAFDLLLVGIALAFLISPWFAILSVPYIAVDVVTVMIGLVPGRWRVVKLAIMGIRDAFFFLALLYGSVRYRRLLI